MSITKKLSLYLSVITVFVAFPALAFAQSVATAATNKFDTMGWMGLSAGLAIGAAALGGALGQGRTASAALEGIARQPSAAARIQTPMILGLALIESLVLFAFVIAITLTVGIDLG
jgi:F-type H+-transporting ATPase subunit c